MEGTAASAGASSLELRSWAFVASLVGGILVATGGLVMGLMMLMMGGMMGSTFMMGMPGSAVMSAWGLVTGGVMVFGAVRVRRSAEEAMPWGVATLVASALSLPAMGGFLIGAVLGIVGGGLAISSARHA